MSKKSFFRERTVAQIRGLSVRQVTNQRGLVERIDGLDPAEEALEIRSQLVPGKFFRNVQTGSEASRKCLKHGHKKENGLAIKLSHPSTRRGCYESPEIPLSIRARDFEQLEKMREEDIDYIGYSVQPTWGDKTKRVFPFVWLLEGLRLYAYADTMTGGIKVESYTDAKRVRRDGGSFVVGVPSRSKKSPRYKFRLDHVPTIRAAENLATVLTLRPSVLVGAETGEPVQGRTPHEVYLVKYGYQTDPEKDDVVTAYPHDLAGYLGIVKSELQQHNMTPMEMNPFALFSRRGAAFYNRLNNNVVVLDPTLTSKAKLRKPHLAEKCILLARGIGKFGHDSFAFWEPGRDGMLKGYDWSITA